MVSFSPHLVIVTVIVLALEMMEYDLEGCISILKEYHDLGGSKTQIQATEKAQRVSACCASLAT